MLGFCVLSSATLSGPNHSIHGNQLEEKLSGNDDFSSFRLSPSTFLDEVVHV